MSPSDEKARVAALRRYAVLDTPPEEPFDRIARLAARWFDAPIALVTLVDEDRQWFKAGIGFDEEETPLDQSFCVYTIRDEGVMIVEDATEDERFADNPLVTGDPGFRFYAGAPLVTPDGYRIGSVCVLDTAPRVLDDPASLDTLQDLADMAMDQMQLRVTQPHHTDVLESITNAFFALDDEWQFTYLNEQAEALLQRSRDELLGRNVWEEFPEAVELEFYAQYHRAVREGERVQFEAYFPPLNTWFQVSAYPFDGGLSVFFDDITARRAAEEALRAREEYLSVMLRSIGDAVIATDPEGRVTEMNPLAERLTGWALDAAAGRPLADIFHIQNSKTGAPVESPVQKVLDEGQVVGLANHTMLTARDGTRYQIADSAAPIRTDAGVLLGVVMVFRDVTDKYRQEEALRAERNLLTGIFDTSATAITVVDANGQIIRANDRAEEVLGLGESEVEGRAYDDSVWNHLAADGSPLPDEELPFVRVMESEAPVHDAQYTIEWPDGRRRILSINGAPLRDDDGTVTGAVFSLDDITEEYERREALETQRERLEMALIGGNIGMWDWDMQTDDTVYDERWAAIIGCTLDEVEYENTFFERHTHPDDLERIYNDIKQHAAGELPYLDQEIRMRHKDGSWRWVLDRGKIVEWAEDGTPLRMVGTHVDITEKKRREEALRKRTIALRQAQTITQTGSGTIDLVKGTMDLSDEAGRLLGLDSSVEQPIEAFMELVHPDDLDLVEREFERVAAGEIHDETYRVIPADSDTVRWLRGQGRPEVDADGTVTRVFSTIADITEEKERQQALRESRQLLEESQRIAHLGHWDWNVDTGDIHWSAETYRIFGYEPGAFEPTRTSYFEAIPEPDRERIVALNQQSIETGDMRPVEHRIVRPDGSERVVELTGVIMEADTESRPTRVVGTVLDITERKERERELRRQRDLLDQTQRLAGAWEYYLEDGHVEWSDEVYRIHEVPIGTPVQGEDGIRFYAPEAQPVLREAVDRAIERNTSWDLELPLITAKGNRRWVRTVGTPVQGENGEVVKLTGAFQDITERKTAERAVERSLAEKQRILESTMDGYMLHDMEGIIVEVNPAYCEMVGRDRDTLIGMDIRDLDVNFSPEAIDRRIEKYPEVEHSRFETQHIHRDGHHVDLDVTATMMENEQGERLVNAFMRDITARKEAEEALRESEERYRTLVERSHDAIYIYRGNRLLFVNERVQEMTGYTEDELLSMDVFNLVHPADRERVRQHARGRTSGEAPNRYEARILRKDGDVRYADFSVQGITYQGEPAGIGSIRDITKRRIVEEALRESEQRFRALAEETTDLVTRHAPDGTYLYASPAAQDVLGYAPEDLVGRTFQPLVHPDDREHVETHVAMAQQEGRQVQFEYRIRHADGHYLWVETAGQHISGDGAAATLIASTRSVEERKGAEQALMRREQRVEALYEAMRGLTKARTHEQVAEHILSLIKDTLGYPISAVRYRTEDGKLVPVAITSNSQALMPDRPDYDLSKDSLVARAFHRGETVYHDDVQALDLPYDLGVVRAAAYVPIGEHGTISVGSLYVGAIDEFDLKLIEILARNADGVIERIDREDTLRAARDEAEEMNRLKSAFLANMSHEIRTPLTSIIGFSEVLGEQDLGDASRFAHLIQRGGQRLLDTLNSVLDLSQLEAGSMQLAPKDINVAQEVQSAASFFAPRAEQGGVDLHVHLPGDPVEAHLDAAAVQRILNNLLSNAVKFTPPGGQIDLRLSTSSDHVILEVEDTGVGMDDEFLPHLFDAFRQESTGNARAFEGSGLGLAITQQLVHLMGGTIDVATMKDEGTHFTVQLPRHVPE